MNCPECGTYACANQTAMFAVALGCHHPNCKHYNQEEVVLKVQVLLLGLVRGMEKWASEEDGIYERAWDAYTQAKAALGEPVIDADGDK